MHRSSKHLLSLTVPTSTNTSWDTFHLSLFPSKRASAVALCWVTWFVYHITISSPTTITFQDGRRLDHMHQHLIEGRIVHKLPVDGLHADGTDVEYRCRVGEQIHQPKRYRLWGGLNGTRQPLQHPLNQSGVMDFATHISDMKLRVLIVGNSLGEQLHAGLEESMCYPINMTAAVTPSDRILLRNLANCNTNFAENTDGQWIKEPRIVSTPSGGMIAVIKDNTNMIDTKTKWTQNNTAIRSLIKALKINNNIGEKNAAINTERDNLLDVLVYQFQSGHVDLRDFDEYYLEEAIVAASELFQANTVIFPTLAWMNNVDNSRVQVWHEVNERIHNFARVYTPRSKITVDSVHVIDIAELSKSYIEANAKILDIPPNETYTLRVDSRWESLVAQMCASLPFAEDPRGCLPGMVSHDGMHLCPETFHGRINAALVCLLDCKFNRPAVHLRSLLACSDGCNSKYMNLHPIAFPLTADLSEEISLTS